MSKRPSMSQIEQWALDGVAEAIDGCQVETDGECEHGEPSWLVHLGMI
ncbi:hypothetical protein [Nocardia tengchongensis]